MMLKFYTKFFPSLLQTKFCLFLSLCLGSLIFTSCASASYDKTSNAPQSIVSSDALQEIADVAQINEAIPQKKPQLIKKARMTVIVKSLDKSIDAVEQVIDRHKGVR